MLDQSTIQTISVVLTGLTVSIAAIYYTLTLRYTRMIMKTTLETRQVQMFMNLFIYHLNYNFNKQAGQQLMEWKWEDFEDFDRKYGLKSNPEAWTWWTLIMNWFEGISLLADSNLVNIDVIDKWVGAWFRSFWEKFEPIVIKYRTHLDRPVFYKNLEELYSHLEKLHPEK
jgi:hypothetical protein